MEITDLTQLVGTIKNLYTNNGFRKIGLQLPEGLMRYALKVEEEVRSFSPEISLAIFADIVYGACCVCDVSAHLAGCDVLVHAGHSSIVDKLVVPTTYVPLDLRLDAAKVANAIHDAVTNGILNQAQHPTKSAVRLSTGPASVPLLSTAQFCAQLPVIRDLLKTQGDLLIDLPTAKPLRPGEFLGCTVPRVSSGTKVIIVLADGLFHHEAVMMAYPDTTIVRIDPFTCEIAQNSALQVREALYRQRTALISKSRRARRFGVVLGTLGRQGSAAVLRNIQEWFQDGQQGLPEGSSDRKELAITVLLSELFPSSLRPYAQTLGIECWIQIACPRLSYDWGSEFGDMCVITPAEFFAGAVAADGDIAPGDILPAPNQCISMDNFEIEDSSSAAQCAGGQKAMHEDDARRDGACQCPWRASLR